MGTIALSSLEHAGALFCSVKKRKSKSIVQTSLQSLSNQVLDMRGDAANRPSSKGDLSCQLCNNCKAQQMKIVSSALIAEPSNSKLSVLQQLCTKPIEHLCCCFTTKCVQICVSFLSCKTGMPTKTTSLSLNTKGGQASERLTTDWTCK